jgi:hypothetical protein
MYLIKLKDHKSNKETVIDYTTDYQSYNEIFNDIINKLDVNKSFVSTISDGVAEISEYIKHVNLGYFYNTIEQKTEHLYTLSLIEIDPRFDYSDSEPEESESDSPEESEPESANLCDIKDKYISFVNDISINKWGNEFINELKNRFSQPNSGLVSNQTIIL